MEMSTEDRVGFADSGGAAPEDIANNPVGTGRQPKDKVGQRCRERGTSEHRWARGKGHQLFS